MHVELSTALPWFLICLSVALWALVPGLSYFMFRPYADFLRHKVALSVMGFPTLIAIIGTALRGEAASMIPIYFLGSAVYFGSFAVLYHYVGRLISRTKRP